MFTTSHPYSHEFRDMMVKVLTIAASDSIGGAGIQADLKTIALLGAYGMSVITAVTSQNTLGVHGIHPVPPAFVEDQLESILKDVTPDALKTGVLYDEAITEVVAKKIKQYGLDMLVVDPVIASSHGNSLKEGDALEAMVDSLFPLAFLITPNLSEASILCGMNIDNLKSMEEAARKIHAMGPRWVLLKGGHLRLEESTDILYDGKNFYYFSSPRVQTIHTHGTGCVFSAAIATFLGMGKEVAEAVALAKEIVTSSLKASLNIGKGQGPINPYVPLSKEQEKYRVIEALKRAAEKLGDEELGFLIPEVQSNLGMALSSAEGIEDIAAFPGRIINVKGRLKIPFPPEFGCSKHVARIILSIMKYDRNFRSAMNIRYSPEILGRCRSLGYRIEEFNRKEEPKDIKEKEGLSLEWATEKVIGGKDKIPDIIFDTGDVGKEPMIRVIGRDCNEVVEKVLSLKEEKK